MARRKNGLSPRMRPLAQSLETDEPSSVLWQGTPELVKRAEFRAKQLEAILEAVPDGIMVLDKQGNVVEANSALADLLGLPDWREALGPLAHYSRFVQFFRPDGRPLPPEESGIVRALRGERVAQAEVRIRLGDGTERLVQYSAAPVFGDGGQVVQAVVVARDVTQQRRWERHREVLARVAQALSQELDMEAVLTTVVDQTLQALGADVAYVLLADNSQKVLHLAAYRNLRPETVEYLRQVPFRSPSIGARAFATGRVQVVEDASRLGPALSTTRAFAEAEGVRSILAEPLRAGPRRVGAIVYGTRNPRRFAPEELETVARVCDLFGMAIDNSRLYRESQARAEELEEERRRREVFISTVAHELNNRMTPLRGYSQILARRPEALSGAQRKALEAIALEVDRLHRLVTDLLDVSRLEARSFQLERAPMDLVQVARSVVEAQQLATIRHRVRLEAPDRLEGEWDRDRIAQVLTNLVSNAIKYSPGGGEVRVSIERTDDQAKTCVSDQGIGIDPEDIPYLFEPYSRLYRERRAKGLGLGLYICRGIVEGHGGRIWAESPGPGKGSTFCFTLPLHPARGRRPGTAG